MKEKIFEKAEEIFLAVATFLTILIVLPIFTSPFDFGKQIFLLAVSFSAFVLFAAKAIKNKGFSFVKGKTILFLGALFLVSIISTFLNSTNKISSLISFSGAGSLLLLIIFYFLVQNLPKVRLVVISLLLSGVIMSLLSLILFGGAFKFPLLFPSLNLAVSENFSLSGSLLAQAIFLSLLIPIGFALAYEYFLEKKIVFSVLCFAANIIILAGLGIGIHLLSSSSKPILLPGEIGWNIAMETIKNTKYALFGVGPGQFAAAFTLFKPLTFNLTPLWNLKFASSNWFFQLLTETGLLGLLIYFLLSWEVVKKEISAIRKAVPSFLTLALGLSLIAFLVIQFFLPINFTLLFVFIVLLALFEAVRMDGEKRKHIDLAPLGDTIYLFLIFPLIIWGALLFFGFKLSFANAIFVNSIKAANRNDGAKTYDLQIKAIKTDPSSVTYHIAYSQTNFALANALASKKDLTDNDRNTITQLIQQSIREAKSAIALDPSNSGGWENIAGLYRNLINFAQGADVWTVSAYQEAVKLDPLNPQLRLDLGGVYFSQKNYSGAILAFNQAASLKPDFANAHYNLANALKEAGAFADAVREYGAALSLVKIDSNDYQKVSSELEEVKKKLPVAPTPTPGTPETLSTPKPPAKGIKPPIALPNEEAPVTTGVTVTPGITVTPTISPTVSP